MENRTADIIQETRRIRLRKKNESSSSQNQGSSFGTLRQQPMMPGRTQPQTHMDSETQLKASRDVRCQLCSTGCNQITIFYMLTFLCSFVPLFLTVQNIILFHCALKEANSNAWQYDLSFPCLIKCNLYFSVMKFYLLRF